MAAGSLCTNIIRSRWWTRPRNARDRPARRLRSATREGSIDSVGYGAARRRRGRCECVHHADSWCRGQVWNGKYSLLRYAGEKTGTSLAARQPEPDFSDEYTFVTACSRECVATVVDGPRPATPTLPLPPRYTWNGSTWVHIYEWQWELSGRRRSEG